LAAFEGVIIALRVSVLPTRILVDALRETSVTAMLLGSVGVLGLPFPPESVVPLPQAARENPITATGAIITISLNDAFIANLLRKLAISEETASNPYRTIQ
jgi:hypothetical protein